MIELTIDGLAAGVPEGATLLEAASGLGIRIPVLCFLEGLPHHTSCMVCLVEEHGSGRLLPACATPASPGQEILTGGARVLAARRAALELLLAEHLGDCEAPCTRACPAHPDIPRMIRRLAAGDSAGALRTLVERLPLAGTLARICPAPCERACRRGQVDSPVAICRLKQAAVAGLTGRVPWTPPRAPDTGRRVLIVGGGPAGLSAAWFLALRGHRCIVVDENERPGGRLSAAAGLPAEVLTADLALLSRLGVELRTGVRVEGGRELERLRDGQDALVLTPGSPEALASLLPETPEAGGFDRSTGACALPGVFAAGNAVRRQPSGLAVQAVADGRRAARSVDLFLAGAPVTPEPKSFDSRLGPLSEQELRLLAEEADEAALRPHTDGDAAREAWRCLACDCARKVSCSLRRLAGEYGADARHFAEIRPGAERGGPANSAPAAPAASPRLQRLRGTGGIRFEPGKCIRCGICVRIAEAAGDRPGLAFSGRGYGVRLRVPFDEDLGHALGSSAALCVVRCPTGALARENMEEDRG